jgi:hypothetical protein
MGEDEDRWFRDRSFDREDRLREERRQVHEAREHEAFTTREADDWRRLNESLRDQQEDPDDHGIRRDLSRGDAATSAQDVDGDRDDIFVLHPVTIDGGASPAPEQGGGADTVVDPGRGAGSAAQGRTAGVGGANPHHPPSVRGTGQASFAPASPDDFGTGTAGPHVPEKGADGGIRPFRVVPDIDRLPTDPPARFFDGTVAAQGTVVIRQGQPTEPPLTSGPDRRTADILDQTINQFAPENNRRYIDPEKTVCNIFVWDVTRALGAEIPHYIDVNTGDILSRDEVLKQLKTAGLAGKLDKASMASAGMAEVGATGALDWLETYGASNGWREIEDPEEAQRLADAGQPVVPVWGNRAGGHGHIAILRPQTETRRATKVRGHLDPLIANVGGKNGSNNKLVSTVSKSFGNLSVRYFAHR